MLLADIDWTTFFSALSAFLAAAAVYLGRKGPQAANTATVAAKTVARAAVTVQAEAARTATAVDGVHATLNGSGILGTLRRIERKQEDHEAEDKAHFAKTDTALAEVTKEVKDIHTKAAVVAAAVKRGIVIHPESDPETH